MTEKTAKTSYRYGTQQDFAFGESDLFYQIRILSKKTDASVEIYGSSTHMNPTVTDLKPIFKIDKGQQLKVRNHQTKVHTVLSTRHATCFYFFLIHVKTKTDPMSRK